MGNYDKIQLLTVRGIVKYVALCSYGRKWKVLESINNIQYVDGRIWNTLKKYNIKT